MKSNNEKTPGFDDIIFRDRNKEYGAYKIRKSYNSTMGYSLLGGLALAVALVVLPSLTTTKASSLPSSKIVVIMPDPDLEKLLQIQNDIEKPAPPENLIQNNFVAPVVSDDSVIINDREFIAPDFDGVKDGDPVEIPEETGEPEIPAPAKPAPFITVEEMPEFPGGPMALMKYIADNLVYPVAALENGVQGKITVRFVVSPSGAVEEVTIMASKGTAPDLTVLEDEALRVIRTLPVWEPGKQSGVPVPVYYTVPVIFAIKGL